MSTHVTNGHAMSRGFTLVEVLVVVALAAILCSIAVPSLASFQRSTDVRSAASGFFTALQVARAEAMKRSLSTYVVPATPGDWAGGWIVFADVDGDQALDRDADTVVLETGAIATRVAVAPAVDGASQFADGTDLYIRFNGSGFPQTKGGGLGGGAIEFHVAGEPQPRRRVVLNLVGRARMCDPARDTTEECRY
jgi:type IV fimbrial biogenesis protein FimT